VIKEADGASVYPTTMSTPPTNSWRSRLDNVLIPAFTALQKKSDSANGRGERFIQLLKEACALVRWHSDAPSAEHAALVEAVEAFANNAINWAYGDAGLFDFIPSYAHTEREPCIDEKWPESEMCACSIRLVNSTGWSVNDRRQPQGSRRLF
jgi:hypothetical protein